MFKEWKFQWILVHVFTLLPPWAGVIYHKFYVFVYCFATKCMPTCCASRINELDAITLLHWIYGLLICHLHFRSGSITFCFDHFMNELAHTYFIHNTKCVSMRSISTLFFCILIAPSILLCTQCTYTIHYHPSFYLNGKFSFGTFWDTFFPYTFWEEKNFHTFWEIFLKLLTIWKDLVIHDSMPSEIRNVFSENAKLKSFKVF